METFFLFSDQIEAPDVEVGVDPLASSYEDMVVAILSGTPDPRLLPDTND